MPPIDLAGLHRVTAKGRTYVYAWRGGPRLTAEPGSPAFIEQLAAAQAGRKGGDPGKLSGLCIAWRASDHWRSLSPKTRENWQPWLTRIQAHFGGLSLAQFDRPAIRPHLRRWHQSFRATPRAADMGKQVLSRLLTFGVEEGRLAANLAEGLPNLYAGDRSGLIWTPDDMAELARHAAPEVMLACRLAALTGLRKSDLLRLTWRHVGPLAIEIATGKSRRRKTTLIPIYGELRDLLAEITAFQRTQRETVLRRCRDQGRPPTPAPTTVLTNSHGKPWAGGFGSSFNKTIRPPNTQGGGDGSPPWTPLHFHDFRGTAATRMYLGGLTLREIAAIFTWSEKHVEEMINTYVLKDELLRDRIRRLDAATSGITRTGTPGEQAV
jgi:integrase